MDRITILGYYANSDNPVLMPQKVTSAQSPFFAYRNFYGKYSKNESIHKKLQ